MNSSQVRFDYLLNRFKTGQASEEERQELGALLQKEWEQMEPGQPADHIDWQQMLNSIKQEGRAEIPVRKIPVWWRAAAVVLLLTGAGTLYYIHNRHLPRPVVAIKMQTPPRDILPGQNKAILTLSGGRQIVLDSTAADTVLTEGSDIIASAKGSVAYNPGSPAPDDSILYNTLSTPKGGQYRLTLPDGTKVWLNAASSIKYPTAFNGKSRTVVVTGETYFEVVGKPNQPFIVRTGKMAVTVLGTSFNINAYADESSIKTSLLEGSIKISNSDQTVRLTPGQQAKLDSASNLQVSKMTNPAAAVAWKNGYFSFDKADIPTVMRQLARWYDIEVSYEGGSAPPDYFWGDLKRNATLSDIFAVLAKSGIYFTLNGNQVLVLNKH